MPEIDLQAIPDHRLLEAALRERFFYFTNKVFKTLNPGKPFNPAWYVEVMADWLSMAGLGDINRLIVTLPPRHLKSITASVALPAWILGRDPSARITCISYSVDLTEKHARDCRKVMEAEWYRRLFPATRISRKRAANHDYETTKGGGRLATSVGGTLTGRGGNWIIVDDPIKPEDARSKARRLSTNQWFDHTVPSRLDSPETGVMVIVMQRVHQDDLVGHVTAKESWQEIRLPAIAEEAECFTLWDDRDVGRQAGEALDPARISLETLAQIKRNIGSFAFESQYQQNPIPEAGNLVKWAWFRSYDDLPPPTRQTDRIVQSWDTAVSASDSADWSVCTTWAIRGNDYYLLDIFRDRCDFPTLKAKVTELKTHYDASVVLIEDAGAAQGLIQMLRTENKLRPMAIKPEGSKEDRMAAQSAVIEAGQVYLPTRASWLSDFRLEMTAFPGGRHDDQVDSVSQFLAWTTRPQPTVRVLKLLA